MAVFICLLPYKFIQANIADYEILLANRLSVVNGHFNQSTQTCEAVIKVNVLSLYACDVVFVLLRKGGLRRLDGTVWYTVHWGMIMICHW